MTSASVLAEKLQSLGSLTQLPKGTFIFGQGDPARGVFIIERGLASLSLSGPDGLPTWSRIVGHGSILGLPSSISGEPYTLTAVAIEDVNATFVSRDMLHELMKRNVQVAGQVVRILSEELADLRRKMSLLRHIPNDGVSDLAGSRSSPWRRSLCERNLPLGRIFFSSRFGPGVLASCRILACARNSRESEL